MCEEEVRSFTLNQWLNIVSTNKLLLDIECNDINVLTAVNKV